MEVGGSAIMIKGTHGERSGLCGEAPLCLEPGGSPLDPPLEAGLWRQIQSEQLDLLCDWVEKSGLSFMVPPEQPAEEWESVQRWAVGFGMLPPDSVMPGLN